MKHQKLAITIAVAATCSLLVLYYTRETSDRTSTLVSGPIRNQSTHSTAIPIAKVQASLGSESAQESGAARNVSALPGGYVVELLENRLKQKLSDTEARSVQRRFNELKQAREAIELSLAAAERLDDGTTFISIPPYKENGEILYTAFVHDLTGDLGAARSSELLTQLESLVRADNFGLGQQPQSILIQDQGEYYHVARGLTHATAQDGKLIIPDIITSGTLSKSDLSIYTYLKPYFPDTATSKKQG